MKTNSTIDRADLNASLERLDIRELEERMEVSPLLAAPDVYSYDRCFCEGACSTVEAPVIQDPISIDLFPWWLYR